MNGTQGINQQSDERFSIGLGGFGGQPMSALQIERVADPGLAHQPDTGRHSQLGDFVRGNLGGKFRGTYLTVLDYPLAIADKYSNDNRAVGFLLVFDKDGMTLCGFGMSILDGTPIEVEIHQNEFHSIGEWLTVERDLTHLKPLTADEIRELQDIQAVLLQQRRSEENRRQMNYHGFSAPANPELKWFISSVMPKVTYLIDYFTKPGTEQVLATLLMSERIVKKLRTHKKFQNIAIVPQNANPHIFRQMLDQMAEMMGSYPNKEELGKILSEHKPFSDALFEIDLFGTVSGRVRGYYETREETFTAEELMSKLKSTQEGYRLLQSELGTAREYEDRGMPMHRDSALRTKEHVPHYPAQKHMMAKGGLPPPEAMHERLDQSMGVGEDRSAVTEVDELADDPVIPISPRGHSPFPMKEAIQDGGIDGPGMYDMPGDGMLDEFEPPVEDVLDDDIEPIDQPFDGGGLTDNEPPIEDEFMKVDEEHLEDKANGTKTRRGGGGPNE